MSEKGHKTAELIKVESRSSVSWKRSVLLVKGDMRCEHVKNVFPFLFSVHKCNNLCCNDVTQSLNFIVMTLSGDGKKTSILCLIFYGAYGVAGMRFQSNISLVLHMSSECRKHIVLHIKRK